MIAAQVCNPPSGNTWRHRAITTRMLPMRSWKWLSVASAVALLAPAGLATALPRGTRVAAYKRGLNFPVDMAWVQGTRRVFFTEKNTGKVRILDGRRLRRRACVNLDVNAGGERGALGLALHPRFKRNHKLYVFYTNSSPLENRVTRFVVKDRRCTRPRHIVRGLDASTDYHNGGQLEFMRRKLYVSTGEAHDPARAQARTNRHGKILRVRPNGKVPRTNPFRRRGRPSPVWSYGHRNPFGLTHEPGTRRIYSTENGPQCDDELNRISKGRNYGWGPGYVCGTAGVGRRPKRPLHRWSSVVVPTDPWWYKGRLARLSGDLYVGDYATGRLHRFVLGRRGRHVLRHWTIFNARSGIVDVAKGPGGWLYFLTPYSIRRIIRR